MGIPSYFSYIVKNHPEILQQFIKGTLKVHNLYMDCNSIIYDCYYSLEEKDIDEHIAKTIIKNVINKIKNYIQIISPENKVYISFDGVAPVAKLEQQRERRYKSLFQSKIKQQIDDSISSKHKWTTASITPGTVFMKTLNDEIYKEFTKESNFTQKIIISASDQPGEGEHKLFQYIRNNNFHKDETTIIYGLDADLIMLALNHIPQCDKIYLFRETPEFIKSIDASLEPNWHYVLDIPSLADNIVIDMQKNTSFTEFDKHNRLYDYIFLCFFLGNDFMPHFPALNIRTGGVDKMLAHYKKTIGDSNNFIIKEGKIMWKTLRKLIESLSQCEEEYIITEYKQRCTREKGFYNMDLSTKEKKLEYMEYIPCFERKNEHYINPVKEGWNYRYYKTLFECEPTPERVKQICVNYMEGLEWTFKYYRSSCPDWRWKYNYSYPPLLSDLLKHIPYFDTTFIKQNDHKSVHPHVQLSYVLPKDNLSLLPYEIYKLLTTKYNHYYSDDCPFLWAYCKYFWESHVLLPEINIQELEAIV